MRPPVAVVHVVAKTHLDLGFTGLAAEVEAAYLADHFPRALATTEELAARAGPERLVWTTGSWILHRALAAEAGGGPTPVADAVDAGHLAWHALPVTTHTELMDAALVRTGLSISAALDRRFGRTTTAAKMTDVPGHTRGLVPLLAEAGVTFLHLGVNPAWPVPDVPPVFRWRASSGAEVVVAYGAGGYGGTVVVPGCDEALAFLHTGDNLGPPSVDDVLTGHAELRATFPDAEVRASTLDGWARALAASGAVADLPVVTAEIGDPWIFGAASDPAKVSAYREVLRRCAQRDRTADDVEAARRELLLVAEHTWGLDQKVALPGEGRWARADLPTLRATEAGRRFEASWAEQRAYVDRAAAALDAEPTASPTGEPVAEVPTRAVPGDPGTVRTGPWPWAPAGERCEPVVAGVPADAGWEPVDPGTPLDLGGWSVVVAPDDGAISGLVDRRRGTVLADPAHRLGRLTYRSFDEADYERFYAGLAVEPADGWWARLDNTKPGIDAAGARSGRWAPRVLGSWRRGGEVLVALAFDRDLVDELGAPEDPWLLVRDRGCGGDAGSALELVAGWGAKAANRLPEALWWSFAPSVLEPDRWLMDKLGEPVSPLDVVRHGGRALHGVGERGVAYEGPLPSRSASAGPASDVGNLTIRTPDAPLVAPGRPGLLDADPPLPDLAGGWHVLLADNCWGTNFPMWIEGPARFRVVLELT